MDQTCFRWQLPRQVEDAASVQRLESDLQPRSQCFCARLVEHSAARSSKVSLLVVAGSWLFVLRPQEARLAGASEGGNSPQPGGTRTASAWALAAQWRLPRQGCVWSDRRLGITDLPNDSTLQAIAIGTSFAPGTGITDLEGTGNIMRIFTTAPLFETSPDGSPLPPVSVTSASRPPGATFDASRDILLHDLLEPEEDPAQIIDIVPIHADGRWILIHGAQHLLVIDARSAIRVLRPSARQRGSKAGAALRRWFQQWRSWTRVPASDTHLHDLAARYACTYGYGGCVQMKRGVSASMLCVLRQHQIETWRVTDSEVALVATSGALLDQLSRTMSIDRSDLVPLYLGGVDDSEGVVLGVATFTSAGPASDGEHVVGRSSGSMQPEDDRRLHLQLWAIPLRHRFQEEMVWELNEPLLLREMGVAVLEDIFLNVSWGFADDFVFVLEKSTRVLHWSSAVWGLRASEQVRGEVILGATLTDSAVGEAVCAFGAASGVGALALFTNGAVGQFRPPYNAPIGIAFDHGSSIVSGKRPADRTLQTLMTILMLEAASENEAAAASFRHAQAAWDRSSLESAVQRIHDRIIARSTEFMPKSISEQAALESQLVWLRHLCGFLVTRTLQAAAGSTHGSLWDELSTGNRLCLTQSVYSLYIALALRRELNAKASASWDTMSHLVLHENLLHAAPSDAVPTLLSALYRFCADERDRYLASETDILPEFLDILLQAAFYVARLVLDGVCIARADRAQLRDLEQSACPWLHDPKAPFSLLMELLTEELPGYLAQQKRFQCAETMQILYEVIKSRIELEQSRDVRSEAPSPKTLELLERLRLAGFETEAARLAREYGAFEILMRIAEDAVVMREDPAWASEFLDACFVDLGRAFAWYAFDWWFERKAYVAIFSRKSDLLRDWLTERQHIQWMWIQHLADENYTQAAVSLLKVEAEQTDEVQDALFYLGTAILCAQLAEPPDASLASQARLRLQRARSYKQLGQSKFQPFQTLVDWFKETGACAPLPDLASNALSLLQIADIEGVDLALHAAVLEAVMHREWYLWERLFAPNSPLNDLEKESILEQTALRHVLQQRPALAQNSQVMDRLCAVYPDAARYLRQCFT